MKINTHYSNQINLDKGVICICWFVCPIITHESSDQFASNLD